MSGFIDLHCHCVFGIDDGVRDAVEGLALLRALAGAGFERVVATPHMRPGLFDNDRAAIEAAFTTSVASCSGTPNGTAEWYSLGPALPELALSSEHYFDDVVFERLLGGQGLPYPGGKAVLLEFWEMDLPPSIDHQLARLRRNGLVPVIAHPERYRAVWKNPDVLERMLDVGAAALLDTAALVGKYGRQAKRSAEELLGRGLYQAACSDSHRPDDVKQVQAGIEAIRNEYGAEEVELLFSTGPRRLLEGQLSA